MTELHVLNLGAGVQSTELYLMFMAGELTFGHLMDMQPDHQGYSWDADKPISLDCAIFADTQEEVGAEERRRGLPDPPDSTYAHLDWLISLNGPPILTRTKSCLGEDLRTGQNTTGQRFAAIPAFTRAVSIPGAASPEVGMVQRQCTKEYKTEVIERTIRRELLGLEPGQRMPEDVIVHQYIGISWDERSRAFDIERRFKNEKGDWKRGFRVHFPLLSPSLRMTRGDCEVRLVEQVPHRVYGSACVFCPYTDDATWKRRKEANDLSWKRATGVDEMLRQPGVVVNRQLDQQLFIHRACQPLIQIELTGARQSGFVFECEGGCGL